MKKKLSIIAIFTVLIAAAVICRVRHINAGYPSGTEAVIRTLPFSYEAGGTTVTITGHELHYNAENADSPFYECRVKVSLQVGDELPENPASLFPIALTCFNVGPTNIQAYSESLVNEDAHRFAFEPNTTVEGYVTFRLGDTLSEVRDVGLMIEPRAYAEVYAQRWAAGKLYYEYIPLEVKDASS